MADSNEESPEIAEIKSLCSAINSELEPRRAAMRELARKVGNGDSDAARLLKTRLGELSHTMLPSEMFEELGKLDAFENNGEKLALGLLMDGVLAIPSGKEGKLATSAAVQAVVNIANMIAAQKPQTPEKAEIAEKAARGLRVRGYSLAADGIFEAIGNGRLPIRLAFRERIGNIAIRLKQSMDAPAPSQQPAHSRAAH